MDPHIQGWNPAAAQGQGLRRLVSAIGVWRAAGIVSVGGSLLVMLGQVVMPYPDRPGDIVGNVAGSIHAGELNTARPATVATADQLANVQALAQARGQQQVIAATTAQQYGLMTATPSILASWVAQAGCAYGTMNHDAKWQESCGYARQLNAGINDQAGAAMDRLGTARAWGVPPQSGGTDQVADAAPLNQVEYNRIARFEQYLSAEAVTHAKDGLNLNTNRGERRYLANLTAAAGE